MKTQKALVIVNGLGLMFLGSLALFTGYEIYGAGLRLK